MVNILQLKLQSGITLAILTLQPLWGGGGGGGGGGGWFVTAFPEHLYKAAIFSYNYTCIDKNSTEVCVTPTLRKIMWENI